MAILLLAAFAARVWHLGYKSLWLDEGISVTFSQDEPRQVIRTLIERDIHPPLYYLYLHYWMVIAGRSEWAVRLPSVLFGTLLVALLYRFARQVYPGGAGWCTGLLAAALAASSPFLLYYSQEARMYEALALAGLASTAALPWALAGAGSRRQTAARWAVYALLTAIPPYLQHLGWMVVGAHAVFIALTVRRHGRQTLGWVAAMVAVLAAYAPWVGPAVRQATRLQETPDFWRGVLTFWFVAQHAFAAFAVGFGGALERYVMVLVAFLGAFALGVALLAWRGVLRGRSGDLLVFVYLVVPIVVLYAVVARNPKFADRYLILIVPPFLLLLGRGVVGLGELGQALRRRWLPAAVAAFGLAAALAVGLVVVSAQEARRVYDDDAYAKDDNRAAVDYLINHWQQGDAVLLMLDSYGVFDYYSHGWLARYGANQPDLPFAARLLNQIVADGHTRLWVLLWSPDWADPSGEVRALMDESTERLPSTSGFRGLELRLYSLKDHPVFEANRAPQHRLDVDLGDALHLDGLDPGPADPTPAGQPRRIALYWRALRSIPEDLKLSLRLRRDGHEWWRVDERPAAYTFPTMYWQPGRAVRGSFAIAIPPGTPPGRYDLEAVIYRADTGKELPLQRPGRSPSDVPLVLASIPVGRAADPAIVDDLPVRPGPRADLGGVELLGARPAAERADAGSQIEVTAALRLTGLPLEANVDYWLIDAAGQHWHLSTAPPVDGQYPFSRWSTGEVVVDRRTLTVPLQTPSGPARLVLTVRRPDEAPRAEAGVAIGTIQIASRPRVMAPPSGGTPAAARFGELARLVSFELPPTVERGRALRVALNWQAMSQSDKNYTVFVHVVDASERPLAQRDGVPGGGTFPTSGWLPGEYLRDEYAVPIAPNVPPGDYRVIVGLYDPRTGQRLPVASSEGMGLGDRYVLASVGVR